MDSDSAERSAQLASFSTWLARERELRGLTRDDVVKATRLAPAVVEALEAGEPSRLPPRAYVLGYLRAYAAAVAVVIGSDRSLE
jgi:cytoskeletal protein RodZ